MHVCICKSELDFSFHVLLFCSFFFLKNLVYNNLLSVNKSSNDEKSYGRFLLRKERNLETNAYCIGA